MIVEDRELLNITFKCLTYVLAKRKMYYIFRCFVGHKTNNSNSIVSSIICSLDSLQDIREDISYADASFFYYAKNKKELFDFLTPTILLLNKKNSDLPMETQIKAKIAITINTLLHFCFESSVKNLSLIESIGEESFKLACQKTLETMQLS